MKDTRFGVSMGVRSGKIFSYVFKLAVTLAFGFSMQVAHAEPAADAEKLLTDSLGFFNTVLRDPNSGQYLDSISLDEKAHAEFNTSVAATGMGIISLTLSEAMGLRTDSRQLIEKSLTFLLGDGRVGGKPYQSEISKFGWYRHWFDIRLGESNDWSRQDGFSTIDTAIVVAAAQMAAKYFESVNKDPQGTLRALADKLMLKVDWSSAIADMNQGKLYLHFEFGTDKALGPGTNVFNESILIACLGKAAETKRGTPGPMTEFWNTHYKDPEKLPHRRFEDVDLLTDYPGRFVSSFALQFSTYLCSDVNNSPQYLKYLENAQKADLRFFTRTRPDSHLWGAGAGELAYRDPNDKDQYKSDYHADAIDDDLRNMVSPHIIAGFLPVYPKGLQDLLWMRANQKCTYNFKGFALLWRCGLDDSTVPVGRLQAVDYSTMFLGLSTLNSHIGFSWFKRFAGGITGNSGVQISNR